MELPVDICFCMDATMSTGPIIRAIKYHLQDIAAGFYLGRATGVKLDKKYALIAYRDPVDRPRDHPAPEKFKLKHRWDEHEILDFGGLEALEEFLEGVESYGGGDGPEDWAGALELALNRLSWRDGKKGIVWIADANAHGRRFSTEEDRDHHPEEENRLVDLIHELARREIYFIGVNVRRGTEAGCAKTLSEIRTICQSARGKPVTVDELVIPEAENGEYVDPDADLNEDVLGPMLATITRGMARILEDDPKV